MELYQESERCLHKSRESLLALKELLPELLKRCQQVHKLRKVMLEAAANGTTINAKLREKLSILEQQVQDLRQHILQEVDECGEELQDVRLIVTACISLDDKLLEKPVAEGVLEFCRSCHGRRKEMMERMKKLKMVKSTVLEDDNLESNFAAVVNESSETLLLREYLVRLRNVLDQLVQCNVHLTKVRAESYIERFEETRANAQMEKKTLQDLLGRWCERNQEHETKVWSNHGPLAETLLSAFEVELDDHLVAAIKEDIDRFLNIAPKKEFIREKKKPPLKIPKFKKPPHPQQQHDEDDMERDESKQTFGLLPAFSSKSTKTIKNKKQSGKLSNTLVVARKPSIRKPAKNGRELNLEINGFGF